MAAGIYLNIWPGTSDHCPGNRSSNEDRCVPKEDETSQQGRLAASVILVAA